MFSFLPQVLCGVCGSYSGHLYERLAADLGTEDGLSMKSEFCTEYIAACNEQIDLPVYGNQEFGEEVDYCTMHTGGGEEDLFWSYPYELSEYMYNLKFRSFSLKSPFFFSCTRSSLKCDPLYDTAV